MSRKDFLILVINPGSTHDEVAVYQGEEEVFKESIGYSMDELKPFEEQKITTQYDFRKKHIKESLAAKGIDLAKIDAVIGRGGFIHPVPSGVIKVNKAMVDDLTEARYGDHSSNLGGILAYVVGKTFKKPAFIADPVVVDELWPIARYSGMPENPRKSIFHCLNQKRVARLAAKKMGKEYEDLNLIVMHAGAGTTIGAHVKGKTVDVNNGLDGEGPFTPQRAGTVPTGALAKICFSGEFTLDDIKVKLSRKGGLRAYLGTSDLKIIEQYINGKSLPDEHNLEIDKLTPEYAKEVLDAMCYQMAKEIGALAAGLKGKVDAIVLTGGVMKCPPCRELITESVKWIAPVMVLPGGDETRALRDAVNRVLSGEEEAMEYKAEKK